MSLNSDFDELKKIWPSLSPFMRIILAISLTSSALSVASLADQVFELKGFIITAIEFWHTISSPILDFLAKITGIRIFQGIFDASVVLVTFFALLFRQIRAHLEKWKTMALNVFAMFVALAILLVLPSILAMFLSSMLKPLQAEGFSESIAKGMGSFYAAGIPILGLLPSLKLSEQNPFYQAPPLPKLLRITTYQLLLIYFLVAVMAAISEGLFRVSN